MNKVQRKQIDEQTISFLNLIENFSKTEDDIINIFDKANQYMKEPLKGIINQFVLDSRLNGNIDEAFEKLIKKLCGTKLSDVIESLKICSEHDSNYEMVVSDSKKSVNVYLKSLSVRNAIRNSARVDMAALVLALFIIVKLLNSFLSENIWIIMTGSFIGIGILLYFAAVFMISAYLLFFN